MIFLELILQNFGPYCGRQVINLDTRNDEDTRPIILLGGMNGGGKTTLMDAIRLALYGHRAQCSTRGNLSYSDFLSQCVNSHIPSTDKTRIELTFEHIKDDQPTRHKIVRTWEKNPQDGKDSLGILEILEDNTDWSDEALTNTWDEYIENMLPLGISNLFLFDGEQVKELAEQETPPPLVVDAIRGLLGLELADRLTVDLEILVNRKRKEIADIKELANLEEIEEKLKQQQTEYQANENELGELQEKLLFAEKQQQASFDKFISEGGKIAGERSQLDKQQEEKTAQAESIRQEMRELAADVLPLMLISPLLTQAKIQAEKEALGQQSQVARDVLLKRDDRLLNLMNQLNMDEDQLEKIQSFLNQDLESLYTEVAVETPWLFADDAAREQLANITNNLEAVKKTAQQQLKSLQIQEEEIISLERQLQTAASPEAYQKLVDVLKSDQNQVAKLQAAQEKTLHHRIELNTAMDKLKKELRQYTEQNIERNNKEHIIAASAKVQATLKLFRDRLTLRKLNKLEVEVTECFRYLLHKSDLVHRVAIDTKSFGLSLYDSAGKSVPKHRLSAGEKQLLAIAFLWGLARVSGRRLPVAIDTPLGRLDSSHRGNLIERYFPSASHQVILLSTDTEIGKSEVERLRANDAIAHEYLLKYDSSTRQTTIQPGYFWPDETTIGTH